MNNQNIPPYNMEAEMNVLGSLMIDQSNADEVISLLNPTDFYIASHGDVFKVIIELLKKSQPTDIVTVSDSIGELNGEPAIAFTGRLAKETVNPANVKIYAKLVKEKAILRSVIAAGYNMAEKAYQHKGSDVINVVSDAEKELGKVTDMMVSEKTDTHVGGGINRVVDILESRLKQRTTLLGMSTGIEDLDRLTDGLQKGGYYLLAARPAMGKTTLALNLCVTSLRAKRRVVIFSIEMPEDQIIMKMLAAMANLELDKIKRPITMDDTDWAKFSMASAELKGYELEIIDNSRMTPSLMRLELLRIQREKGHIDMVMVDYLQLMKADSENRTQEISTISMELNSMKKEFKTVMLALSQLNRSLESRTDKRPVSSDLRESGQLEQDADVIMFIYRDEVYDENSPDKGLAELLVRKNRLGLIGKAGSVFNGPMQRFEPLGNNVLRSHEGKLPPMKKKFSSM